MACRKKVGGLDYRPLALSLDSGERNKGTPAGGLGHHHGAAQRWTQAGRLCYSKT